MAAMGEEKPNTRRFPSSLSIAKALVFLFLNICIVICGKRKRTISHKNNIKTTLAYLVQIYSCIHLNLMSKDQMVIICRHICEML